MLKESRTGSTERILLVLDDDADIIQFVERMLLTVQASVFKQTIFSKIMTARNEKEAREVLSHSSVSHVLADIDLGRNEPRGYQVVYKLRREFPCIERAILFTGGEGLETDILPPGIDAAFRKTDPVEFIIAAIVKE